MSRLFFWFVSVVTWSCNVFLSAFAVFSRSEERRVGEGLGGGGGGGG